MKYNFKLVWLLIFGLMVTEGFAKPRVTLNQNPITHNHQTGAIVTVQSQSSNRCYCYCSES